MNEKIDFVIPWVDPTDENWLKEKEKYQNELKNQNIDAREHRFRDWENLKYWFRGVEEFAPWVNKIHFVTFSHIPNWLNTEHPKLNIVKHRDFIPDEYLPTFNANTIELNLHRIDGLSENFVYFNDDLFIVKPVRKEDFFKNNLPCDSAILNPIVAFNRDGFEQTIQNDTRIINLYFEKNKCIQKHFFKWFNLKYRRHLLKTLCLLPWKYFVGFLNPHLTSSLKKETYRTLWDKEYNLLDQTSKSRFRNNSKNVNQWLINYWQISTGKFHPRDIKFGKFFEYGQDNKKIYDAILKQKYKVICLNDNDDKEFNFEKEKLNTINVFEKIFPNKSSFEK